LINLLGVKQIIVGINKVRFFWLLLFFIIAFSLFFFFIVSYFLPCYFFCCVFIAFLSFVSCSLFATLFR
jgi:hypothetical protein